jgi:hypothetical protein
VHWRANHPFGAREFIAQIFLSILVLCVTFAALPDCGFRVRFRAFRVYPLNLGATGVLRVEPERLQLLAATTPKPIARSLFGSRVHAALKDRPHRWHFDPDYAAIIELRRCHLPHRHRVYRLNGIYHFIH